MWYSFTNMTRENPSKNESIIENLDEKYDFKISESVIDEMIDHLEQIENTDVAKVSESMKAIESNPVKS